MKFGGKKLVLISALSMLAFPLLAQDNPTPPTPNTAAPARTITIHAKRYEFVPAEITLKKDQTVELQLTSDDVEHSLVVSDLGINGIMKKGEVTDITVTPTKLGDFRGRCGISCGIGHRNMHFMVHVVN